MRASGATRSASSDIMNLVPGNRLQARLDADQGELPHSGQWAALHMLEDEVFLGSERYRMCYL